MAAGFLCSMKRIYKRDGMKDPNPPSVHNQDEDGDYPEFKDIVDYLLTSEGIIPKTE